MEGDEQAIKTEWDENDKEASPLTSEAAKEKEDKEDKEGITDLDLSADAPLTSQNTLEGKSVIDHTMSRLERIAECSHSPHESIDVQVVPVTQQIIETTEKVRLFGNLIFICVEIANQLLTRQWLYLVPWMNGNTFSFWNMNKVSFLLVRCLCNEMWNLSSWSTRVKHSKRSSISPCIHVFSIMWLDVICLTLQRPSSVSEEVSPDLTSGTDLTASVITSPPEVCIRTRVRE